MLTPQEVTGTQFEKAIFGGYDIASVDKFLDQLTQDYTALYRENGILKNKMKVLVDKVEEYRSTEDAMRMALLSAEKTAKEITAKAEAQRDTVDAETAARREELLGEVEAEAALRKEEITAELAAEEEALRRAKTATSLYVEKLKNAMAAYMESVSKIYDFAEPLPVAEPEPEAESAAEPEAEPETSTEPTKEVVVEEKKPDTISDSAVLNIAEIINRSFNSAEEAEQPADAEESPSAKLPKIDYDNLQFGRDFGKKK